jgi:Kef-type K+ transport system membrane component KefB
VPGVLAAIDVDPGSFLAVVTAAAVASATVLFLGRWVRIPVVVFELVLGIIIGPHVLHFADSDDFIMFFSNLGLGLLFFFAGYEINFERIRGRPLRLAAWGWGISLALAYGIGGLLAWAGVVLSLLYTGSAMATTAIGTLIPILTDAGEMRTRFGTYLLGAGAMGEFGPIVLVTLVLSGSQPFHEALILIGFVALAVGGAVGVIRLVPSSWSALERSLESSNQLAIRLAVVLVFALVALASELGLDILLGGFAAGIILRVALRGREVAVFESKLVAIGYGFLIPFFFIYSGMTFDLPALETMSALLKLPLFFVLFLVIRGVPAMVLYRGALDRRNRLALAFYSSVQLPLVVAITSIAIDDGDMRSSTAAALVGAAILSTLVYPLVGLRLRGDRPRTDIDTDVERELEREGYKGRQALA